MKKNSSAKKLFLVLFLLLQFTTFAAAVQDIEQMEQDLAAQLAAITLQENDFIESLTRGGEGGTAHPELQQVVDFNDAYQQFISAKARYLVGHYADKSEELWQQHSKKIVTLSVSDLGILDQQLNRIRALRGTIISFIDRPKPRYPATELSAFTDALNSYTRNLRALVEDRRPNTIWSQLKGAWRDRKIWAAFGRFALSTYRDQKAAPGATPITDRIAPFFRAIREVEGSRVLIEGNRAEIGYEPGEGELVIYAPVHSHPIYDDAAWPELKINSPLFMAKTSAFLPPFLSKKMGTADSIIEVDAEGVNPVEKAIKMIKEHGLRKAILFPQGMISNGFYDTIPVSPPFLALLLKKILNEGIKVRLVPISLPNAMRLLNKGTSITGPAVEGDFENIRMHLHEAIPDELLRKLIIKEKNADAVAAYLRFLWLRQNLARDSHVLAGTPRFSELIRRADAYLYTASYCEAEAMLGGKLF